MIHRGRHLCLLILLLGLAPAVHAGCTRNPDWGGTRIVAAPGGSFSADPALPVGTVITEGRLTMPTPSKATRQYIPIARCSVGTTEIFVGTRPLWSGDLFSTNVPGIGYRLIYPNGWHAPQAISNTNKGYLLYYPAGDFQIQFVKTGAISPGIVPAGRYGFDSVNGYEDFITFMLRAPIVVTVPTCRVAAGSVQQTVNFGDVASTDFSGIGTGAASRPFSIRLQCDAAVSAVGLTFDAAPDPSGQPGTLRLSGGRSAASGVGIQVLGADGKPIDWHRRIALPIASGEARIDMSARYLQTAKEIRGGTANGVMTFTITY
ncbi:fimbrial protein [Burkholderia glumae]|uniref:Fimbrial protein n=1 Tax=Burkholderia glumae TaxID=337 RepID=A0AAP9Y2P9_BURGL|nr:fimbrial protein [Burkholderia glumae]ACR29388.1 fimbria adhesin protein [Burkholderia glumae BGR1]AJY65483.1 fimbrial family protein [Burkholderia glumae LMG 2196 = ATCC 33617]KHJ63893.1 fimbria adhesin protein [Burkholderia glumae]MCM2482880.1 fimbrial protein [Burkholderia glumae]MCM2493670.1 fimbrial protein [Burkholderia glumae]